MANATATATPEATKNGQAAAPSSVSRDQDPDAGIGTSAPISEEEAAILRGDAVATTEGTDEEVQAGAESADDAGDEAGGEESPESGEEPGESDEGDLDADAIFKDALRMAKGDPKAALRILQAAIGDEGEADAGKGPAGAQRTDAAAIETSISAEVSRDVEKFYADRGTEEKPGDERKALSDLLTRQRLATVQAVGTILDRFEGSLNAKTQSKEAMAALWKEHPEWVKEKAEFMRFVAERPSRRSLDPVDAYDLFLAKKAKRSGSASAKKDAAIAAATARKQKGAAAQAGVGGRPSGPTERPTLTTEQREMQTLRQMPKRFTLP